MRKKKQKMTAVFTAENNTDTQPDITEIEFGITETKSKSKRHLKNILSSQNFLPVRDIEQGIIITTDGRFIKLMEFTPVNFDLRSAAEQAAIISQFGAVLRSMPSTVQFKVVTNRADVDMFIEKIQKELRTEENPDCRELQQEQISLIRKVGATGGLTRHFYVAFEYETPKSSAAKPDFDSIAGELNRQGRTIRSALKQCGNEQVSVDGDDLWTMSALYAILCRYESFSTSFPDRMAGVIASYSGDSRLDFTKPLTLPVNDFIAPGYIDRRNSPKYIVIDDMYYTFAYIKSESYPLRAFGGWPQALMNLGEGIDVDIWVHKEDPANIRRKLQYKLRYNKVKMQDTEDTSQDYDDLQAAIQSGYYLKSGIASGDDFCYFGSMITVTAYSVADLNYRLNEVKNFCIRSDLVLRPCNFLQSEAFFMTLPICSIHPGLWGKMRRNALLSQFACAYPFTSFEMTDENGILLGTSTQNGSLVFVDTFDTRKYSNANMAILGASGSGKTYTLQCMALRMREKKQQVFIIAPLKGFEFERACTAVGGQYVKIAPGSGQNINIMEIRKMTDSFSESTEEGPNHNESILSKKIQQLHVFFTLLIPDIQYEEKQLLDEALMKTYAKAGITNKNQSLEDPRRPGHYKKMPILGDLHEELNNLGPQAKRLYNILTRFVSGSASSFNCQTNVNLNNQYVVLDVSALTNEMLPIGMFIALDYVWDKAREDRTKQKSIFVDETWRLIGPGSSVLAAEFVLEIFKVIRGYGGSAIAATQDINDFFALDNGRFGAGVINNSRIKILLRPEAKEAANLQSILELTDSETEKVKTMERGDCLLVANTNHLFIKIKASSKEHDLITTDRRDLLRIASERQQEKVRRELEQQETE